jgi:hypothetical protein
MTIPRRLEELLEEQQMLLTASIVGDLNAVAGASDVAAFAQGGMDPVSDGEALAADAVAGTADAISFVPKIWGALKGFGSKLWGNKTVSNALKVQGAEKVTGIGNGQSAPPVPSLAPSIGAYGGNDSLGGPVRVGPMLTSASKQAGSNMEMEILEKVKDIPRLLEMILETICRCGQPTAGKFNGMPHCIPGSGCADNIARSQSNPDGDNCVSCGNPNCSGSFHGQPICSPGQGCNDHWDSENGTRKWNPLMESPEEKIADHDDWAAKTNHGDTEMPEEENEHSGTTWE